MLKKNSFLFIICLLLFSCSGRIKTDVDGNLYTKGIDTNNIEFLNVYSDKKSDKIYVQGFYKGSFVYFSGDISKIYIKNKVDNRVFDNKIIRLQSFKEKNNDNERFAELKKNNDFNKIEIIKYEAWSSIILPILEKTIIKIVPKEKDQAIVVSMANKDLAIFYNNKDLITIEKVEYLKKNVKIIKNYSELEFFNMLVVEIKKLNILKKKMKNHLMIFEIKNTSGANSPYVLFDDLNNNQYYFDFSNFYKTKQSVSNIDYYIQILFNSVIKAHIIEPIKNPITTIQKGSTFTFQTILKTFENKKIENLEKVPPLNTNQEKMDIVKFEKKLDKIVGKKKYKGSMEYLIGGQAFFTDFLNEMEKSKNEIFVRLYIFSNDDYGVRIANLLKNKSNEKIKIRVLTGGLANNAESIKKSPIPFDNDFKQPNSIGQYLTYKSKVNFRTSADTFFMFDHSKMIIIDKKLAYVGGMNIGQAYRYSWHDMMIKLHGEIVHEVHNQFTQAWASAGPFGDLGTYLTYINNFNPPSKELQKYYKKDLKKQVDIRILYTKPQNKSIYKSQLFAISQAKKFIYIQNPYLADYKIINALIKARGRGVEIKIFLPSKNNVGLMASSNLVATNIFLKNGIKVYKYNGMTHIKAAIYDGWASLGSANFDNLSLKINDEFNIGFSDEYYVNKLKRELFETDLKVSEEVKEPYIVNWYDKVMSAFANRF